MKGPQKYVYIELCCNGCNFLRSNLFISGQNPIYIYRCKKTKMITIQTHQEERIIYQGPCLQVPAPDWCPYLKGESE